MKIGLITLDGYTNYGNVFQRTALYYYLSNMVSQVDVVEPVWHVANNFFPLTFKWGWKEIIKNIINWKDFRGKMKQNEMGWEMIRQTNIRRFCQRSISIRMLYGHLEENVDEYDYFITGSDQVWNPLFTSTRCRDEFLTFAPSEKRISYAASIGLSSLPEQDVEHFRTWLGEMKAISVREQAGAKIVKDLTGLDVPVHVDPTLLLGADEWASLEEAPAWYDGKPYICTYFLGERPAVVAELAAESSLPVINILDKKVFDHYITSPEEFLWLIHHASLVYTDSFHGTVFSILFERPFVVCDRVEAGGCNMRSRIDTLLGLFHLENRYAKAETGNRILEPFKMEYPDLAPIFARERQRSHDYLKNALGVKD